MGGITSFALSTCTASKAFSANAPRIMGSNNFGKFFCAPSIGIKHAVHHSRAIKVKTSAASDKATRDFWADDEDGGSNNGGNGGDDDGNGGGNDDPSDGGEPPFSGNVWVLLTAALAALGVFGADDVSTLKRLLREVFADLVKVRGRLDELENVTGVNSSDLITDATPLEASTTRKSNSEPSGRSRSVLSGALKIGGGLLWEDGAVGGGLGAVGNAGVRLGTDLILRVGGPVRGGKDAVMAEVRVDPGEEQFALQKILYSCRIGAGIRAILAPFGARGQDVAYTLNPLAGQGLTSAVKHGNPLHQKILGSVIGAAADLKRAWLSLALFSQTNESGVAQDTVMAQAVVSPIPAISIGLTVLEPKENISLDALMSSRSEAPTPRPGSSNLAPTPPLAGPQRQLGATLALAGGDLAVHGWATADAETIETKAWHDVQWGMTLGLQGDGSGNGWCVGVAKVAAAGPGPQSEDLVEALQPNLLEVSTQWNLGDGMFLTPGVVVLRRDGQNTVFVGVKTSWLF